MLGLGEIQYMRKPPQDSHIRTGAFQRSQGGGVILGA